LFVEEGSCATVTRDVNSNRKHSQVLSKTDGRPLVPLSDAPFLSPSFQDLE